MLSASVSYPGNSSLFENSVTGPIIANRTSALEIMGLESISEYTKTFSAAVKRLAMIAASICKDCSFCSKKHVLLLSF